MPETFDPTTGQTIDTTPAPPEEPILMRAPDKAGGGLYRVPLERARAALDSGYQPLSPEEEKQHALTLEARQQGFAGSALAGAGSFLKEASFGLIVPYEDTPEALEHRQALEAMHGTAQALGGAAGFGASLLHGGPIFKAAGSAGAAVARGIVPAAELADAALATKLAGKAIDFATQGALLSTPQALIDGIVQKDPDAAVETMLWGIGAGAALGSAGELLSAGGRGIKRGAAALLGEPSLQAAAEKFANERTLKAYGALRSTLNPLSKEEMGKIADFAHNRGLIREGMSRAELGEALEAEHARAGGAIGETITALDDLARKGTADEDLVDRFLRPGQLGDAIRSAIDVPENMLSMPIHADLRHALEDVVQSANKLPTIKVNGRDVVSFEAAQDFVSALNKKWRSAVSKDVNRGGVKGLEVVTALDTMKSEAYQVARDTLHAAGDEVARASNNPTLIGKLAAAKSDYHYVNQLEKFAAIRDRQAAGNRLVSLTDFMHMGQGPLAGVAQGLGAGLGGALAGVPGAMVGGFAGKVPGIVADFFLKHWAEDKGLVHLAVLSKKLAKSGPGVLGAMLTASGQARLEATLGQVRENVKRLAERGIVEVGARSQHMQHLVGPTTGLSTDQQHAKLRARLEGLAADPAAMAQVTAELAAPIREASPTFGEAYQQKLIRTLGYLYEALPKPDRPPLPFAPDDWQPTRTASLAFHDKAEIIANPMRAWDHVQAGTLSDAHLHALTTVYPSILSLMRNEALKFSAEHPEVKLPLPERRSLGKLLGMPLDPTSTPQGILMLQATYAGKGHGGPPGATLPGAKGQRMPRGKVKNLPTAATDFGPNGPDHGENA